MSSGFELVCFEPQVAEVEIFPSNANVHYCERKTVGIFEASRKRDDGKVEIFNTSKSLEVHEKPNLNYVHQMYIYSWYTQRSSYSSCHYR